MKPVAVVLYLISLALAATPGYDSTATLEAKNTWFTAS